MDTKIDWEKVYSFFLASEQNTLKSTAEYFQLDYEYLRQKSASEEWVKRKQEIANAAHAIIEERTRDEIVKHNEELAKLGRAMVYQGAQKIAEGVELKTPKEIKDFILAGIEIQKHGLGLDNNVLASQEEPKKVIITWGNGTPLTSYDEQRKAHSY